MRQTSIAIVGISSSGKSSLLYALYLLGTRGEGKWLLRPDGAPADAWITRAEEQLEQGKAPPATRDIEDLRFRIEPRDRPEVPAFCTRILDVAGEVVEALNASDSAPETERRRIEELKAFLRESTGALVVVDPERLTTSADTVVSRLCDRVAQALHEVEAESGSERLARSPLALLFTKADLFQQETLSSAEREAVAGALVNPEEFAKARGLGGVFPSFVRHLEHFKLFAVSAFGRARRLGEGENAWVPRGRQMQPWNVAEAFDWLMDEVEKVKEERAGELKAQARKRFWRARGRNALVGGLAVAAGLTTLDALSFTTYYVRRGAQQGPATEAVVDLDRYLTWSVPGLFRGQASEELAEQEVAALKVLRQELSVVAEGEGVWIWTRHDAFVTRVVDLQESLHAVSPTFEAALTELAAEGTRVAAQAYADSLKARWRTGERLADHWSRWASLWREARGAVGGRSEAARGPALAFLADARATAEAEQAGRLRDLTPAALLKAFACEPPAHPELQGSLLTGLLDALGEAWRGLPGDEPRAARWERALGLRRRADWLLGRWDLAPEPERDALAGWTERTERGCRDAVYEEIDATLDLFERAALIGRAREVSRPAELEERWQRSLTDLADEESRRWSALLARDERACGATDRAHLLKALGEFVRRHPSSAHRAQASLLRKTYRGLLHELPLATRWVLPTRAWSAVDTSEAGLPHRGRVAVFRRGQGEAEAAVYVLPRGAKRMDFVRALSGRKHVVSGQGRGTPWVFSLLDSAGARTTLLWVERVGRALVLVVRAGEAGLHAEVDALLSAFQTPSNLTLRLGRLALTEDSVQEADHYLELQVGDSLATSPWARPRGAALDWQGAEPLRVSLSRQDEPTLRLLRRRAAEEDEVLAVWRLSDLDLLRRGRQTLEAPRVRSFEVEVE